MSKTLNSLGSQEILSRLSRVGDIRDKALLYLIASTGLYVDELLSLTIDAVNSKGQYLVTVGNRPREVYLSAEAVAYLEAWLLVRPETDHRFFFSSRTGKHAQLSQRGIDNIIQKWGAQLEMDLNYRVLKNCAKELGPASIEKELKEEKENLSQASVPVTTLLGALLIVVSCLFKLISFLRSPEPLEED